MLPQNLQQSLARLSDPATARWVGHTKENSATKIKQRTINQILLCRMPILYHLDGTVISWEISANTNMGNTVSDVPWQSSSNCAQPLSVFLSSVCACIMTWLDWSTCWTAGADCFLNPASCFSDVGDTGSYRQHRLTAHTVSTKRSQAVARTADHTAS